MFDWALPVGNLLRGSIVVRGVNLLTLSRVPGGTIELEAPLTIRSVVPTDFTQWQPLWEGYNRFYGRDALPTEITQMT